MEIRDIVNRDIVTLTNCERERIHIPGCIQPHGFLFGLISDNFRIVFCSGNTDQFIKIGYTQLLGENFADLLNETQTKIFRNYVSELNNSFTPPLQLTIADIQFDCTVQTNNAGVVIAEFEPVTTNALSIEDLYRQTKHFTAYMQNTTSLQSLCQLVADETRAVTGYDRVMVYRFDEDYNGEVFAESKTDSIEPFLGLHYPHTDIPVQARELYIKNLLRLIVDIDYAPVPIYTIEETATNQNLDLSFSTLRSVSPIHVEYLQNMGVGATLTISLIHENKLWGLITCHHYSAKYINNDIRIAAQLQGHFLTSQISVRERAEEFEMSLETNRLLESFITKCFANKAISPAEIIQQPALLSFAAADGAIIIVDDVLYIAGVVPHENEIRNLAEWLRETASQNGFSTYRLAKVYEPAKSWCGITSGIIYHPFDLQSGDCFILCRCEVLREMNWAGNPEKAIEKNANGLSPRKSFALWKEIKNCESHKWLQSQLTAVSNFANSLQGHIHMLRISREELRQRKLSEKLQEANEELENINWIGSHDLKEPLRKIQLFASRILEESGGKDDGVVKYVEKMNTSAQRMQNLISDILSYSRINHNDGGMEIVNLQQIISKVVADLSFEIKEKNAVLSFRGLPEIKGNPFLLQQLFTNLLSNALKFSRKDIAPQIKIYCRHQMPENIHAPSYLNISISDNGIGFDESHKSEIFKVFKRLHLVSEYTGTGVGLALCKKIMQKHEGVIEAESKPGVGSTFMLYFPDTAATS